MSNCAHVMGFRPRGMVCPICQNGGVAPRIYSERTAKPKAEPRLSHREAETYAQWKAAKEQARKRAIVASFKRDAKARERAAGEPTLNAGTTYPHMRVRPTRVRKPQAQQHPRPSQGPWGDALLGQMRKGNRLKGMRRSADGKVVVRKRKK